MRRICFVFNQWILAFLILGFAFAGCAPTPVSTPEPTQTPAPTKPPADVVLTMGSWRTDDVEQMNHILAKFHERYPNITVKYDPTTAPEYDAALRAQLESGTGPDVFYLRSYSVSRTLYEKGYLAPLGDLPGLMANFTPEMRAPWATEAGKPYGVPFIATSHGIYYNTDLFKQLNISTPKTWPELLVAAQTIKNAGYIPFANATADTWTVAELMFMNLAPNFVGGREGRMEYLNGKRCFNDPGMLAVFQALKDLEPFLPPNQSVVTYSDSQQLFLQGKAAMFLDGSWDIPFFESSKPAFVWSIFAPPPPAGQPSYLTFHLDAGMGMNAASLHKEEARLFLEWMSTQEFAAMLGNELPGFFPMHSQVPILQNEHANTLLLLNQGRGTDVRFAWEKLRDGSPDAYSLIMDGAVAVLNDKQKPQEAADALQAGLAQWFAPAQTCGK
jgi:raffinose/stachyose/melibiose transport system substrate-binding protein